MEQDPTHPDPAQGVTSLILGIGNTILTDDGVGVYAARRAADLLAPGEPVAVTETENGGLELVEIIAGYARLVLIDAIVLPEPPGTVVHRRLEDFGITRHVYGAHGFDLPTAVELGRRLGASMPTEVHIVGISVEDPYTVSEEMTPAVAASVEGAADLALRLARGGAP